MTSQSTPSEGTDKVQIGVSQASQKFLDALEQTGWFAERQDAYRLAVAVALARKLEPTPAQMSGIRTSYNFIGGVDRDGKLRQAIGVLVPNEANRPGAYAERLAQAGLAFMYEALVEGSATLSDVLDPDQMVL